MNRTTYKIFKFIYKNQTSSLHDLYKVFSNKAIVDESYDILKKEKLITNHNGTIQLTITGCDYFFYKRKRFFMNILKIIIVPVTIAVISTLITNLITTSNDKICDCACDCR